MATDLTIVLEDRPGQLARAGEALGNAGVNIEAVSGDTEMGTGRIHLLVEDADAARRALEGAGIEVAAEREVLVVEAEDRPGELGRVSRALGDAGVNIEVVYRASGDRLVFGVDDPAKGRSAVGG